MTTPTTAGPPRNTNPTRTPDVSVCWLVSRHPVTASILVRIGLFSRNRKAGKRLRRLAEQRRIAFVGTINRGLGRPEHVYCGWRPQREDLFIEVQFTELLLRLHAGDLLRQSYVADTVIRPTAQAWIHGTEYYIELDRGTTELGALAERLLAYERSPHRTLWICPTEDRCEALRRQAGSLAAPALFTTLADAVPNPHAEIWRTVSGAKEGLPRE
jgi:hypothetical protein